MSKKIADKAIEAMLCREKESLIYQIIGEFGKEINDKLASKLRAKADEFSEKHNRLITNIRNLSKNMLYEKKD